VSLGGFLGVTTAFGSLYASSSIFLLFPQWYYVENIKKKWWIRKWHVLWAVTNESSVRLRAAVVWRGSSSFHRQLLLPLTRGPSPDSNLANDPTSPMTFLFRKKNHICMFPFFGWSSVRPLIPACFLYWLVSRVRPSFSFCAVWRARCCISLLVRSDSAIGWW